MPKFGDLENIHSKYPIRFDLKILRVWAYMQNILYKIYSVDETLLRIEEHVGRCADCGKAMSLTEEAIVNEFWLEFCEKPDPSFYFDLIVDATQLSTDQFNAFHEPRLCLTCLKNAIHHEN